MILSRRNGFTLIEIAGVLVIIGIVLAGTLVGVRPVVENGRISATNSKLDLIEIALLTYVVNKRLPSLPG